MATNKNAILRYNVLDKCFQNFGRKYFFEDLLEVVNTALFEDNPDNSGVQIRQLRDDIRFMKSDAGYAAPIEAMREGRKAYYRYEDKNFSINNSPLNTTEAEQLRNAVSILQRFEGSPEFEWISELAPMLKDQFGLESSEDRFMAFESNIDYTGYEHITPLFNAIVNKRVLKIVYEPFAKDPRTYSFHPYYLKQYNNRWFLFGKSDFNFPGYLNLALDRINSINEISEKYIECKEDWEDYFFDMIGVSKSDEDHIEEVTLEFSPEQAPYVLTKPIHPSQKSDYLESGYLQVRIKVIVNYELEMKLLSYGEKVRVNSPSILRENLKNRLKEALKNY